MRLEAHPAADLFPMLDDDSLKDLAADIATNGLIEPIWVCGGLVLDGRNRLAACELASVDPVFREYQGDDPIGFAVSQNLHRRHLSTGQKAAVAVEIEPLYAAEAKKRQLASLKQNSTTVQADLPERDGQARDHAAKVAGTSGRAVSQFKRVKEKAPDLADKVKADEISLDRADRIIRDREAEQRKIKEAQRQAEQLDVGTTVDIRHGDFREVLGDLAGIDAIITDPPYPREFLPLLSDLAAWSDKVLKPDGVMAVLIGQSYLPEVYERLSGFRPYRWTIAYMTPGAGYAAHHRQVQSNWKPVLVYGGGNRIADVLRSEGVDASAKDLHKWGQDYSAFQTLIERLTDAGQTVVDPFMGAGTTLLAAKATGRHAIGCDIDLESYQTAKERLQ